MIIPKYTLLLCAFLALSKTNLRGRPFFVVVAATTVSSDESRRSPNTVLRRRVSDLQRRHLTDCDSLQACYLVNIESRTEIKLVSGKNNTARLDLKKYPRGYSIRCDVTDTPNGELDFIKFMYQDVVHEEFGLPRFMNGDSNMGDWINPVNYLQSCGRKTVRVQGHVWSKQCFDHTYSIHLTCPSTDTTCPTSITNLILVDAVQRTDIMELTDFSVRSIRNNQKLNIRAVPNDCVPKTTESVQFRFNNTIIRCEKYVPYALFGDPSTTDRIPNGSKYNGRPISVGTHTITAVPYTGEACTGTKGTPLTRTFTVRP